MNDGGAGLLTHSLSQEAQRNGYLVPLWLVLLTAAPACFSSLQRTTPQHYREQRMPAAKLDSITLCAGWVSSFLRRCAAGQMQIACMAAGVLRISGQYLT